VCSILIDFLQEIYSLKKFSPLYNTVFGDRHDLEVITHPVAQLLPDVVDRCMHSGSLLIAFVKRGIADVMFTAKLGNGRVGLGLLENHNDVVVGKARYLHAEFSKFHF